ncbi:hypothetical protein [Amaricoccus tamworthensis]|uniref:hypothetical protein n=1 Tax=Amaricoccus tamworthensis TaxID=57002 RepID=UPI003C7B2E37
MKTTTATVSHPDLKNSELHHPLKNEPGEKGDQDHAESDGNLSRKGEKTVEDNDSDTGIADALRDAVKND